VVEVTPRSDAFMNEPQRRKNAVPAFAERYYSMQRLAVVDDYTRECSGIEVDTSLGGLRVRRVLDRIASERGLLESIVPDNGPEFRSRALLAMTG
jgi:hypothetical protein